MKQIYENCHKNKFLWLLVYAILLILSGCSKSSSNQEGGNIPAMEKVSASEKIADVEEIPDSEKFSVPEKNETEEEKTTVIWIASDLHYLSPELTDGGELFTKVVENADGKMVGNIEEIVEDLVRKVLEQRPKALILSGDLTFNGEKASLEALAAKLDRVQEAGIPVLVIPGNHDIEYPYAYRYEGEGGEKVDSISESDFREICGKFGYDSAPEKDEVSFSYLYPLTENLGILLLDANTPANPNRICDSTMEWMEECLKDAQEKGMKIITVTHQNLLAQNSLLNLGFVLSNHEALFNLLKKYDVKMHFSGHSHIQHSRTEDGVTDVAVGSLAVTPLRYDMVEITENGEVSYKLASVDVFQEEARDFFDTRTERQVRKALEPLSLDEETAQIMVDFAITANREYFGGTLTEIENIKQSEAWKLWEEVEQKTFWNYYLDSMMD